MSKRIQVFVALVAGCLSISSPAFAQGGTSPVPTLPPDGSAVDDVRKNFPIHLGPLYASPTVLLKELGTDTNVFNEVENPKSDFTFTVTPQAELAVPFARRGLVRGRLGADLVYFAHYTSERSVDPSGMVRAEAYIHRLTPFVQGSRVNTRDRANYEIDSRTRHVQDDVSGGFALRLTSKLSTEVSASHGETRYADDAVADGQRLDETLNRETDAYSLSVFEKLTVLTTVGVKYEQQRDRFLLSPLRDTDSFRVMPGIVFKPKALISGSAWVGYRSFTPTSSLLPAQSGLTSQLGLSYTLLGSTTFGVNYDRDYQYSFEALYPYFVDNSVGLYVRRALGGKFDVMGEAARHRYTYQALAIPADEPLGTPVSVTDNWGVNLGYRVKRQTRIAFGVSYWERNSTLDAAQSYNRYRIGFTGNYGF